MSTATLPRIESGSGTWCALCSSRIGATAEAAVLADLSFHSTCVPACEECGQSLGPALEREWSYQVMIVPSVYGYECMPFHHLCPDCRDTTLATEPSAQD